MSTSLSLRLQRHVDAVRMSNLARRVELGYVELLLAKAGRRLRAPSGWSEVEPGHEQLHDYTTEMEAASKRAPLCHGCGYDHGYSAEQLSSVREDDGSPVDLCPKCLECDMLASPDTIDIVQQV